MAPTNSKNKGAIFLLQGAVLQCLEAASLGMPFEVWKTRNGRFRNETALQSLKEVYRQNGLKGFWAGTSAKMVESALKGAILLFSKELLLDTMKGAGFGDTVSGFAAGAGGGICQVSVMGPCTFLVTAVVTNKGTSVGRVVRSTWKDKGAKGFYPGGTAIAARQATNWASRQGFTEWARGMVKGWFHEGNPNAKLSMPQEALSGVMGGALACWNHPFEVARIEMQARGLAGEAKTNMVTVLKTIYGEHGIRGWFKGLIPRVGLGIWQTLFMVSFAKMVRERWNAPGKKN